MARLMVPEDPPVSLEQYPRRVPQTEFTNSFGSGVINAPIDIAKYLALLGNSGYNKVRQTFMPNRRKAEIEKGNIKNIQGIEDFFGSFSNWLTDRNRLEAKHPNVFKGGEVFGDWATGNALLKRGINFSKTAPGQYAYRQRPYPTQRTYGDMQKYLAGGAVTGEAIKEPLLDRYIGIDSIKDREKYINILMNR